MLTITSTSSNMTVSCNLWAHKMVKGTKMMGSSVVTSMELFAQLGHWGGFLTSSTKVVVLLTVVVVSTVVILSGLGGHN